MNLWPFDFRRTTPAPDTSTREALSRFKAMDAKRTASALNAKPRKAYVWTKAAVLAAELEGSR